MCFLTGNPWADLECAVCFVQQESEYPLVVIGIFIERPTPFVSVFFERLLKLQYPKNMLKLLIFNKVFRAFAI